MTPLAAPELEPATRKFYRHVAEVLSTSGVRFLMGGAYAFQCYTGILRHTKDLDLFVMPDDVGRALAVLGKAGFPGRVVFPHWLAKAWNDGYFVDLIYSSGNGVARVDELWFRNAVPGRLEELPVHLVPAEEMIWSKAFIMERERFDGADVLHVLLARAEYLDWNRLLDRFGPHWHVLLSHLVLFGFVFPGEKDRIPQPVMGELLSRLRVETSSRHPNDRDRVCRGPLLSRAQYLVDVGDWGYHDARLEPAIRMNAGDIDLWTRGIAEDGPGEQLPRAARNARYGPPGHNGRGNRPQ